MSEATSALYLRTCQDYGYTGIAIGAIISVYLFFGPWKIIGKTADKDAFSFKGVSLQLIAQIIVFLVSAGLIYGGKYVGLFLCGER